MGSFYIGKTTKWVVEWENDGVEWLNGRCLLAGYCLAIKHGITLTWQLWEKSEPNVGFNGIEWEKDL